MAKGVETAIAGAVFEMAAMYVAFAAVKYCLAVYK